MAERLVVVGASLAGLSGAEAARRAGFRGAVTIVGAEPYRPYDRQHGSKRMLTGEVAAEATTLPVTVALDCEWRLGVAATGLDLARREVRLSDGTSIGFDKLLIATGARAKPWPDPTQARLDGVFTLRDRDDAARIRAALAARPKRVLVIGAGFIGCEAASCCRELDLPVTVVDPSPTPLGKAMGGTLGATVAALLTTNGVDFRPGATALALEGDARGRLRRAQLSRAGAVDADLAIVALGVERNTDWLDGSGLQADAQGVACDGECRALDPSGGVVEGVFAAGDVARWPHPLYDGRKIALEHWGNAVEQGAFAGRRIAAATAEGAYAWLPAFWSSQFGVNIKSVGLADGADAMAIVQGDPAELRFVAAFGHRGRTIAAFSFNSARWLPAYAEAIVARAAFPPIPGGRDQPERRVMPPGLPNAAPNPHAPEGRRHG